MATFQKTETIFKGKFMIEKVARILPQDINAEAAVLSAMMIDNFSVARAIEMLSEEHFYKAAHKYIYRSMLALFEDNIEIDVITLINKLHQDGVLERIGGNVYINELSDIVISGANIEYHAKIVLERALLRLLITSSNEIIEECYKAEKPVSEIVDDAEQIIFQVAERPEQLGFQRISKIIPETLQNIEDIATTKTSSLGVPSGFKDLDRATGGFRPGQLIILAARPAMGKTSLALNIGFNAAMYHDLKVGIFTMEMASEELLMRMIASASEVTMDSMLKGYGMDTNKLLRITQVADALSSKEIFIDDTGSNTSLDIRAKCRRLKAEIKGLDLIVIDYLQLMSSHRRIESRQQEISEISRNLKVLAKELGIPIICLSQLNRGVEQRDDKRPKLSDLRESGAIEQDADIVMFIYRDDYYNPDSEKKGISEIIISKNRHGATGKVELVFMNEYTSFRNKEYE